MSNPGCEILFPAEEKFWGSPELVEKVLLLLDLASIKELAEAHKLTRIILGGALFWDKLIKKVLPEEEEFMPWGPNSTIFLAYMRPKMKLFCQILDTTEDSDKDLLEKELLHLLCERYSGTNQKSLPYSFNLLCPCGATHQVSAEVFVLLEDVEAALDSTVQKLYKVTGTKCVLFGPFMFSFCSRLAGQVENVEHVIKCGVELADFPAVFF